MDVSTLPRPSSTALTIYLGGHGYGESQVVVFPDGRVLVVDACTAAGGAPTTPLDLLEFLGLDAIDLLVVTHTDLDHCSGVPELLDAVDVDRVWRFPTGSMVEVLARVLEFHPGGPGEARLARLRQTLERLDEEAEEHGVRFVNIATARWPADGPFKVECLAPCSADELFASSQLTEFINWSGSEPELARKVERYLIGDPVGNPSERGNTLSIAVAIEWLGRKVLLGGDVEAHAHRGWNGILPELEEDDRLQLIVDPEVVKLSHHGSSGAWSRAVWDLHTTGGPVETALTTVYQRGGSDGRPPQAETLAQLVSRARRLGATASPVADDWSRFHAAGWTQTAAVGASDEPEHWIAVALHEDGTTSWHGAGKTAWFEA